MPVLYPYPPDGRCRGRPTALHAETGKAPQRDRWYWKYRLLQGSVADL